MRGPCRSSASTAGSCRRASTSGARACRGRVRRFDVRAASRGAGFHRRCRPTIWRRRGGVGRKLVSRTGFGIRRRTSPQRCRTGVQAPRDEGGRHGDLLIARGGIPRRSISRWISSAYRGHLGPAGLTLRLRTCGTPGRWSSRRRSTSPRAADRRGRPRTREPGRGARRARCGFPSAPARLPGSCGCRSRRRD